MVPPGRCCGTALNARRSYRRGGCGFLLRPLLRQAGHRARPWANRQTATPSAIATPRTGSTAVRRPAGDARFLRDRCLGRPRSGPQASGKRPAMADPRHPDARRPRTPGKQFPRSHFARDRPRSGPATVRQAGLQRHPARSKSLSAPANVRQAPPPRPPRRNQTALRAHERPASSSPAATPRQADCAPDPRHAGPSRNPATRRPAGSPPQRLREGTDPASRPRTPGGQSPPATPRQAGCAPRRRTPGMQSRNDAARIRRAHSPANSQHVAPCGSSDATPTARRKVSRYRCHGGGPALGALNGAVSASPSAVAGQPPEW